MNVSFRPGGRTGAMAVVGYVCQNPYVCAADPDPLNAGTSVMRESIPVTG